MVNIFEEKTIDLKEFEITHELSVGWIMVCLAASLHFYSSFQSSVDPDNDLTFYILFNRPWEGEE